MNLYNLTGYLTPDSLPDDRHCRSFRIPNDVQWLSVFMGALLPLIYPENWQVYGSLTQQEAADEMLNVIWDAYDQDFNSCLETSAPWWDTIDDAAAEVPVGDVQPWYGYVELPSMSLGLSPAPLDDPPPYTFIERLQDWVIAGFIVYAGQPAAAVFFLTIAPRFRLAWKTGDLGGIVRVFVDAVEYGRVDTHSDSPGEVHLDVYATDPDIDEHELVVFLDPDSGSRELLDISPVIQVIRKKLDPNEVYPVTIRYNPDTDQVQSDFDLDGVWQDNPGLDPRSNTAMQFPPVTADDPRCQAAANMSRALSNFINDVANTLSWATAAEGLLTTVMGGIAIFFPEGAAIGVFALLGLDLATTIFSAGLTAIQAAFTNDVFDQLTCIFDCNISSDGTVTATQLGAINDAISSDIGGLVSLVTSGMFFLTGNVGLTNMGARGDAPADCSACACCPEGTDWCQMIVNPAVNNDGDFVVYNDSAAPDGWSGNWGVYGFDSSADKWCWQQNQISRSAGVEVARSLRISRTLPTGEYTHAEIDWSVVFGTWVPSDFRSCVITFAGDEILNQTTDASGTAIWDGDYTGTPVVDINILCSYHNNSIDGGGGARIFRVDLAGLGTKPTF